MFGLTRSVALWALLVILSGALMGPGPSLATDTADPRVVLLESQDRSIRLSGTLISFDDAGYTLETGIGRVTIPAGNVSCSGAACPEPPVRQVAISGAHTLGGALVPALIDAFSFARDADVSLGGRDGTGTRHMKLSHYDGTPMAEVSLSTRGSSAGLRDLIAGVADIALTTRPARQAERTAARAAGLGPLEAKPYETVLALDGLLIVTAPENPVRALSMQRIADVFSGRVTNWAELGGNDAPITLYGRAADTGTGATFAGLVMLPTRQRLAPTLQVLGTDAAVSDAVAQDLNGIGFTSYSNERGARAVALRGACGIQTPANAFTIKTEEYPLTQRLYAYRGKAEVPEIVRAFLDFAGSEAAQPVVARTGFVDQGISSLSVNDMGLRFVAAVLPSEVEAELPALQGMMQDLVAADRLSLAFRFEAGSSRLDSRAEADLARLAGQIMEGRLANKEVLLIGFTDSVGRADINTQLSQTRAEQVADRLKSMLPLGTPVRVTPIGYGEMSPLGCNETANGRRINRRVEVWTRDILR